MIAPDDVVAAAFDTMGGPFRWDGVSDCSATACAGFEILTGVDLMAGLRGAYRDRRGAVALIRARGGFVPLWRGQAVGLTEGAEVSGAIGVIRAGALRWRVLGLCVRPGLWAAKTKTGAALLPARVEVAWHA